MSLHIRTRKKIARTTATMAIPATVRIELWRMYSSCICLFCARACSSSSMVLNSWLTFWLSFKPLRRRDWVRRFTISIRSWWVSVTRLCMSFSMVTTVSAGLYASVSVSVYSSWITLLTCVESAFPGANTSPSRLKKLLGFLRITYELVCVITFLRTWGRLSKESCSAISSSICCL